MPFTSARPFKLERLTDLVNIHSAKAFRLITSDGIVEGESWELFSDRLLLDETEVPYDQIESYQICVEGCPSRPFGQYLSQPSPEEGWSLWSCRNGLIAFVPHLVSGTHVRFAIDDDGTFVTGKIHSMTKEHITLAQDAIRVRRLSVAGVCHRLQ